MNPSCVTTATRKNPRATQRRPAIQATEAAMRLESNPTFPKTACQSPAETHTRRTAPAVGTVPSGRCRSQVASPLPGAAAIDIPRLPMGAIGFDAGTESQLSRRHWLPAQSKPGRYNCERQRTRNGCLITSPLLSDREIVLVGKGINHKQWSVLEAPGQAE